MANEILKVTGSNQYSYSYLKGLVTECLTKVSLSGTWNYTPTADGVAIASQLNEMMNNLESAYNKVGQCSANYSSSHYSSNLGAHQSSNKGNNSVCSSSNYSVVRTNNA